MRKMALIVIAVLIATSSSMFDIWSDKWYRNGAGGIISRRGEISEGGFEMMRILTSHSIRKIRDWLNLSGIDCCVNSGTDNNVVLDLSWSKTRMGDWVDGLSLALYLIRDICSDIDITFLGGSDDGDACSAVLNVGYGRD